MKTEKVINLYKKYEHTVALSEKNKKRILEGILANIRSGHTMTTLSAKRNWRFTLMRFGAAMLVLLLCVSGTAFASSGALPGTFLYPVKRAVEKVQISTAKNSDAKVRLQIKFAEERLKELSAVETTKPTIDASSKSEQGGSEDHQTETITALDAETNDSAREDDKETPAQAKAQAEVLKAVSQLEKTEHELNLRGDTKTAEDVARALEAIHKRRAHKNKGQVKGVQSERSQKHSKDNQNTATKHKSADQKEEEQKNENQDNRKRGGRTPEKSLE